MEDDEGSKWDREEAAQIVHCDDDCGAKQNPTTIEEYAVTLRHYRSHGYMCGCSHGR